MNEIKTIYFAGGCFWGLEKYFNHIQGITATAVGYANGETQNPTYEDVCYRHTGHAEAVRVEYDSSRISLPFLLDLFYEAIDPTTLNRQGFDVGTQYRSGVYYTDEAEKPIIEQSVARLQKKTAKPVVVEVLPLKNFYLAEEYHQDYLTKNPGGYCHIGSEKYKDAQSRIVDPYLYRLDKEKALSSLSEQQINVAFHNATEPPFANEYNEHFEKGIYVDIATGEPLFLSQDKFHSSCGWPSFSKPADPAVVQYLEDKTFGMRRTEVRSRVGDIHLGHVFDDGPKESGGARYCINSASIQFIPLEKMKDAGYEKYIPFVQ